MPRKPRIDAPGALHHIICRGIERRRIYRDDSDRQDFLNRLGPILSETRTTCYAWALLPNHFHLLLRTGDVTISIVMRRLLTGYAVRFNRRHRRCGHLFQNRYKSILCQEDAYLLELVRYIHLNPLRAKMVPSMDELDHYEFCGHGVILGKHQKEWQDVDKLLGMFGRRVAAARRDYRAYVEQGIELGRRPDLIGGGLVRSFGGWLAVKSMRRLRIHAKGDERILGESDFVLQVLKQHNEQLEQRTRIRSRGVDPQQAAARVKEIFGLTLEELSHGSRQRAVVKARSVLCYWAVKELGMSGVQTARWLGIGQPAVQRSVIRGEKIVRELSLVLLP
jgi:REP element-mobilizing transposase RayT